MEFASRFESRQLLLQPAHGVENVKLLPALPEIDDARGEVVLVSQVDEGEIL